MNAIEIPYVLEVGPVRIDHMTRTVTVHGRPVPFSRKEYDLLRFLASSPERVFTRREILSEIWDSGYAATATRTIESHASRIRVKLTTANAPGFVRNVWATGYALTSPGQF